MSRAGGPLEARRAEVAARRSIRTRRRRRLTPFTVLLLLAVVGTAAFLVFAVTNRDARQVPLIATGFLAMGVVFGLLTIASAVGTYRAGSDGRSLQALLFAVFGGCCAVAASVAFGLAFVLLELY